MNITTIRVLNYFENLQLTIESQRGGSKLSCSHIMEKIHHILRLFFFLLLFTFSSFIFLIKPTSGADHDYCLPAYCGPNEPEIRFPFRIIGRQPSRCGFPGFDLSCDKNNKTTIRLPSSSRSYIVTYISYVFHEIYIDPEFCKPNRLADINLRDTPFEFSDEQNYKIYNCSVQSFGFKYPAAAVPFPCLSNANYSVIAVRTGLPATSCEQVDEIMLSLYSDGEIKRDLELIWSTPDCRYCELENIACRRLTSDDGQTTCLEPDIPWDSKYVLIIGLGIPALLCILGFVCHMASRVQDCNETHHQSIDLSSTAIIRHPTTRRGLDGATGDSFPNTLLNESRRLPHDDDGTCAICLSDYKRKESLRTIPECNHYFHTDCIDKWLNLKATCSVCRNSTQSSSFVTSSSSTSATSVDPS